MSSPQDQPVTALLQELAAGDKSALDRLLPLLYPELQKLARAYMRKERQGHTLQPTALVHEAYVRLVRQPNPDFRSRAHFLGAAAHLMREILVDHARARKAEKRGANTPQVPLEEAFDASSSEPPILAVEEAMADLARWDPLKARLVEMRYFGGMTAEESAEVLGLGVPEVRRQVRIAQAWLQRELDPDGRGMPPAKA